MRGLMFGIAVLGLAGCGGSDVPSPTERQQQENTGLPQVGENEVVLRGDGLSVGAEAFYFAAGQNEV
ncbi:MAG: aspartate-semialdehyde dehydrogenase, partial [Pseudomonadota bacterium]